MNNVICMKWGTRYGAEYVNRLAAMVRKYLTLPYRFVCFTDDGTGIDPRVEVRPLPEVRLDPERPERGWRKMGVYQEKLADLEGQALFLDLDVVIVGDMNPFFEVPGTFRIIHDWNLHNFVGNSSVFRFEIGAHADLWEYYRTHEEEIWNAHRNEQLYLSVWMRDHGHLQYWNDAWCISFKRHCLRTFPFGYMLPAKKPAPGTRVVVFHGNPNPSVLLNQNWHSKNFLRAVKKTDWIAENWCLEEED